MPPRRIKLAVYVNLDPVQGVMHTSRSAADNVQAALDNVMGHYRPRVDMEDIHEIGLQYKDQAIFVREHMTEAGGIFFMNDKAVVGWWCVRSTLKDKRDLFLPAHIFRKCFVFGDVTNTAGWSAVVEIT